MIDSRAGLLAVLVGALLAALAGPAVAAGRPGGDAGAEPESPPSYWAYGRVERPTPPRVATAGWDQPIDAFIARDVETAGLAPNEPASRRALVRRVHYDLIGLPPTPEAVEAFAADDSPRAFEDLVDRLLASPQFGEKWARHWLDIVRYAESNGYERDSDKAEIWRYRDYVIRAYNSDKPYDRFIIEQLAGDELDAPTVDSIVATGFQRLHLWDDEPVDRLQARYDNLDDIVRTTSGAFLAMSLGCARCHDHKKDPIAQRDYYSFMSFFANLSPMGKNNVFRKLDALARDDTAAAELPSLRQKEDALGRELSALKDVARAELDAEFPALQDAFEPGHVLLADSRREPQEWRFTTQRPVADWMTNGYVATAKPWRKGRAGFGRRGTSGARVRTRWETPDIWLRGQFRLTSIPHSLELIVQQQGNAEVYLNGQLVAEPKGRRTQSRTLALDAKAVAALQTGKNIVAVHCRREGGRPEGGRPVGGPPVGGPQYIDVGLRVGAGPRLEELIEKRAGDVFTAEQADRYREATAQLELAREEILRASGAGRAMCAAERGRDAPKMNVHLRGSAHALGDAVEPAFPAVLRPPRADIQPPPAGVNSTGRRLALARWIASGDNPLTARVVVNRLWQHYFGRGIVATPNDFGRLGTLPSHPQLLDWLAAELMEGGWKLKRLHKMIVLSQAYRMSSRGNEAALASDPANRLFWRHDMRRLTAEEVRDTILAASGELNRKMFGPSMFPELPPEVLATSSTGAGKWGRSPKEEQRRRSIYIKVKRSLLVPSLTDFDFADTDAPCAVRFVSTVPTQALGMLNGKFVNDRAKVFAARLRAECPGDRRAQVARGLEIVTCRPARDGELASCLAFMDQLQQANGLDPAAALERFALLALNLNEFVYLD